MPPNGRIIVHKMRRSSVSITAEKKTAYVEEHGHGAAEQVYCLSWRTFSGHNHDYSMLKQEFSPELDWFTDLNIRVDLGYLGIKSDYRGDQKIGRASCRERV